MRTTFLIMVSCLCILCFTLFLSPSPAPASPGGPAVGDASSFLSPAAEMTFDLPSAIELALKNNPSLRTVQWSIETERYAIDAARAERMPKIDFGAGATRYRYPMPLVPIVLELPFSNVQIPNFESTIYDTGAFFKLALFKGGRITRNIRIAETRKALAEDNYTAARQDLVYNVTSVYHKILQLQKLLASNEAMARQMESHRNNVDQFLRAGTVPRVDLLSTEVELAHAKQNVLLVRNNLESAFDLLKNLMGMDDVEASITIVEPVPAGVIYPPDEEAVSTALRQRPDYRAVAKKQQIAAERVKMAKGKRFPDVNAAAEYTKRAGEATDFKENWSVGARMTIPLFDGGLIRSEIGRERVELERVKEEERALKLSIMREVRDALLNVANATDRMDAAKAAITNAQEVLRVERLKYDTGAGTNTNVIDAQTALLRAETDAHQAAYDKEVGYALLVRCMGAYTAEAGGF
jgi:outer membrane protein